MYQFTYWSLNKEDITKLDNLGSQLGGTGKIKTTNSRKYYKYSPEFQRISHYLMFRIAIIVCKEFKIEFKDIKEYNKKHSSSTPRQAFLYIIRTHYTDWDTDLGPNYLEIDRTRGPEAIVAINKKMAKSQDLAEKIKKIETEISSSFFIIRKEAELKQKFK